MLLKWIRCAVRPGCERDFSVAQEGWSRLAGVSGFRGQLGGWNTRRPGEACVLGRWHDHDAYRRFMADVHDSITDENHQASTYESSSVVLADVLLEMGGGAARPAVAMATSGVLRVADCSVHADRVDHFVAVQQEVWSPAMRTAGMVAGWFARVAATERFLVFSRWPDAATHQAYVDGPFAELRERAGAKGDLARIDGALVDLEPRWSVAGTEPATVHERRTLPEGEG